ncbi:hypothetical protein [Rhodopseudomonas pseudopalustris]|uniref:Uncharacterized protein n=1 Tax=Rhodopseudomonas pseudopalustris TaxID=1513892 RepID=A0A1H8VX94_9BRAD|nr:hypothetical protein [Rhodopseudomonas pseudopalustris]SEP20016.1 hypothetical protein SAMN05444123_11016 [Rhodopseudomonas pseudopalustris]
MTSEIETSLIEICLGPVDRVVITAGHIVERHLPFEQWPFRYFVDLIEEGPDGGDAILWNGATHTEAVVAAREISRDWGNLPIIDRTAGDATQ